MFVPIVKLHCAGECLVAPTEIQYFILKTLNEGVGRFIVKFLVARLFYNVSYASTIDYPP